MKKFIILLGTLLFAAVFMSGCITETPSDDPIVGIWTYDKEYTNPEGTVFTSCSYIFNADGTGYSLAGFSGEPVSGKLDFTWENAGDGKYALMIADAKDTEMPGVMEVVLADGKLLHIFGDEEQAFHRSSAADYIPGLWTGVRADYKEYTDIQVLLYIGEDGTGNLAVYGPEVLNMEDIFTAEFTWDVRENNVVLMGENGGSFELSLVNGELVFAGLYPLHKYTIEDSLSGLWESVEPIVEDGVSYDVVEFIKSDGTGVEIWTVPGSDKASFRYPFTWEMTTSTTYKAVYDDGEVWLFETVNTQLFDGETTYNKVGFDVLSEYAQNKVTA